MKPTLQALRAQLQDSPVVEEISWKATLPIPKTMIVSHFGDAMDLGYLPDLDGFGEHDTTLPN